LKAKFPWLNTDGIVIGSYGTKNEGYFDPWSFVAAMKSKAISLGVTYVKGEVVGARITGNSSRPSIDKVVVKGDSGTTDYTGHTVINAAGAWASNVFNIFRQQAAVPASIRGLPVMPRKRCIFNIHCSHKQLIIPDCDTPLVIDPTGVYFRPEGKNCNKFICGVSPAEVNDPNCESDEAIECVSTDDHRQLFEEVIWPALCERVPAFEELKVVGSWAGFYEYNTLDQVHSLDFD
jgi:FAD-dependent oxidoreductase domain-containing protein 1